MELNQIIEAALNGNLTLDEVKRWVEDNRSLYIKPPLMEPLRNSQTKDNIDHLVNKYSDWDIRIQELSRSLSKLNQSDYIPEQSDLQLRCSEVVHILSKLYEDAFSRAKCAFNFGYTLWNAKKYSDAALVLLEAADLFQLTGKASLEEVTALSYRCDCLHQQRLFDETIACAGDLIYRSRKYGFRGHEALALRDLGLAHSELGRDKEALEPLRAATKLRRSLSENEIHEQSVISLANFLHALGITARKFGYIDEAMLAFLENVKISQEEKDWQHEALALSEIGYLYLGNNETEKGIKYLEKAIKAEEKGEPTKDSERWRNQVESLSGRMVPNLAVDIGEKEDGAFDANDPVLHIEDLYVARLLCEQASDLTKRGKYHQAIQITTQVINWAVEQKDVHCQIICFNVRGICLEHTGRFNEAISEFQKGIRLCGSTASSLDLRYNLASAFYHQEDYQNCADVLRVGIVESERAISRANSFAFSQQIVSGALPLYELFAFQYAQMGNQEYLLAVTELVRARNMRTWAEAQAEIEGKTLPKNIADRFEFQLQELRKIEVELDLRKLTDTFGFTEAEKLQSKAAMLKSQIEEIANQHGLQVRISKSIDSWEPIKEMDEILPTILVPGTAMLSLFSVPEGICFSIFYLDNEGIQSNGSIVLRDLDERAKILSSWTKKVGSLRSQSAKALKIEENEPASLSTERGLKRAFDESPRVVQDQLFKAIIPLIQKLSPNRLVIIPHRELALIPYWEIADCCESIQAVTLIPSLNMLRICVNRSRELIGTTTIVPDVTGTLPKTHFEAEAVQSARKKVDATLETVHQLLEVAPSTNLLHVTAHGVFNENNPYYSGYKMRFSEQTNGLFDHYVKPAKSNQEEHSFRFSETPQEGAYQLMTVADCMARLSLKNCRLAVLSSCECGLSNSNGGGELTGFPKSMLVAGAKSVIAALWPVDDTATAILMARFYHHWAGGAGSCLSPAQALGLARSDLKKMKQPEILDLVGWDTRIPKGETPFDHPIYTDAFHCFGDW